MHPEWNNGANGPQDFDYISSEDEARAYRTRQTPKAKRRETRVKAKPAGIYRRRNHRWSW
jgi:hypothetical protein